MMVTVRTTTAALMKVTVSAGFSAEQHMAAFYNSKQKTVPIPRNEWGMTWYDWNNKWHKTITTRSIQITQTLVTLLVHAEVVMVLSLMTQPFVFVIILCSCFFWSCILLLFRFWFCTPSVLVQSVLCVYIFACVLRFLCSVFSFVCSYVSSV